MAFFPKNKLEKPEKKVSLVRRSPSFKRLKNNPFDEFVVLSEIFDLLRLRKSSMLTACENRRMFQAYRTKLNHANLCTSPSGFLFALSLLVLCAFSFPSMADNSKNTYEYKLDNGLKLIVREDHRAPLLITQVWYKVGSSYEPNGITGISHALEHMMFRGTTRFPDDQFSKLIAISGGDQNAFTYYDFTAYFQELDARSLKLCFELEADRMQNLTLGEEAFAKEINVVMEERRLRTDDNPESVTRERFAAAAHVSNPYHHSVVGWMNDLQNLRVEDVRQWYKNWYGPNNAIVVVVGDVQAKDVYELAKTYFAPLKAIDLPIQKPRKEIAPLGKRNVQVKVKAEVPRLMMGYNVPSFVTAEDPTETYALLVLLMVLDGGKSGRFSTDLIRGDAIAARIDSRYYPFYKHETLLSIYAVPSQGQSLESLEAAFTKQIARLQSELLSEPELKKVKANAIAQHIFEQDALSEQALEIGSLESIGVSWKEGNAYADRIQAVTAQQIQDVAKKYLTPERLTVAQLIPSSAGQ